MKVYKAVIVLLIAVIAFFSGLTVSARGMAVPAAQSLETARQALEIAERVQKENQMLREYMTELVMVQAYIQQHNPRQNAGERYEVAVAIVHTAKKHGIPLDLMLAAVRAESGFKRNTKGEDGERGLLQVLPSTFRLLRPEGDVDDWRQTLDAGGEYLRYCLNLARGDERLAVAYYNAGPGRSPERVMRLAARHVEKVWRYRTEIAGAKL